MLIEFLILFQITFFQDYKNLYEDLLKNKDRCDLLQKKLEGVGKEVEYYTEKKDLQRVKKLLKESHSLSSEYTICRKNQKMIEKKLEKLLPKAREEVENEIANVLSLKISSKEKAAILFNLIEKLKLLSSESTCPIFSVKEIEINENEPKEMIIEKLKIIKSILEDLREEEEKAIKKIEELKREKILRENLWNFLRKVETEGGALLDTRISSSDAKSEIKKIESEIESCQNAVEVYRSFISYWDSLICDFKKKFFSGDGKIMKLEKERER